MSRADVAPRTSGLFGITPQALHHGMQLAACVLLGYGLAVALGLPERFWVVITVLIVMRADADSVVDVGWDRVQGTVVGAVSGLLGVYLQSIGANAMAVTLTIVSVLAFASAARPLLRSSAVAALIVLGAGSIAGHSAMAVAILRVAQIAIGVGVCIALTLVTAQVSTRARLLTGGATLLGRLALQLRMRGVRAAPTEAQVEAGGLAVRTALLGLATLAHSADRRYPWTRTKSRTLHERHHRRIAALFSRVVQGVAVLNRVLALPSNTDDAPAAHAAAKAASAALNSVSLAIAGKGYADFAPMRQLLQDGGCEGVRLTAAVLTAPLRLLLDDLQQLCASVGECNDTTGAVGVGPALQ